MPNVSTLAATKIRETGASAILDLGAVADGQALQRSGNTVAGVLIVSAETMISPLFNQTPEQDLNPRIRWDDAQAVLAARIFGG